MSFIRPQARRLILTWAETAILGICFALSLWAAYRIWPTASVLMKFMPLCAAVIFGVAGVNAALRARLTSAGTAKGVVLIDERRIGYFGPDNGGFVEMQDLMRLEYFDNGWLLTHRAGPPLFVPMDAPNADELLDLFASLPGLSLLRLTAAINGDNPTDRLIWSRKN